MAQSSKQDGGHAHRDDVRRGFVWLGAASAVARVLDVASVFIVLWFVSREELGNATLAWSVSVMLEALNGLGTSYALVQGGELEERTISTAFWYTMGAATVLVLGMWGAAGLIATLYQSAGIAPMIRVSATKLWFVGAALVPLSLLNRKLAYERIAVVSTMASLGSSLLTCGLAAAGFGAWALVIGQTSNGLVSMIGAFIAEPYRPRFVFDWQKFAPHAAFGIKLAGSNSIYQFYRNADYFIMGKLLDVGSVGVYRVAFDLAMTPCLAIATVVNRAAVPVYARLYDDLPELKRTFVWTLESLGLALAPLTVLLALNAEAVLALIKHGEWSQAAPIVPFLCAAAFLRCLHQAFPQLFQGLRKPMFSLYESIASMLVVSSLIYVMLRLFGRSHGGLAVAWAWCLAYPLLLSLMVLFTRLLLPLRLGELVRSQRHSTGSMLAMALAMLGANAVSEGMHPLLRLGLSVPVGLGVFGLYVRHVAGIRMREALSPKRRVQAG